MNPSHWVKAALLAALLTACLAPAPAQAQEPAAEAAADAGPDLFTAERRELTATFRATGHYQAQELQELAVELEAYSGKLVVAEVVEPGARVSRGEVVLKLVAEGLDQQRDDAAFAVTQAELRLAWAKHERDLLAQEHAIAAERAELALADAEQNWTLWEEVNKADRYTAAELELASSEARLEDEREELRQLEELYKGAKLASQTQDIVLGRARRSLAQREQYMEIQRRGHQQTIEVTLPRQERDLKNALGWQRMQSEIAAVRMQIQMDKQSAEIASAERGVESAVRQLKKLEADAAALTLAADREGIVAGLTIKPGDRVQPRQALGTLIASEPNTVTLSIPATDLRVLSIGDTVTVRCVAFGELAAPGTVNHIEHRGTPGSAAGGASFNVEIQLAEVVAAIRPGMAALVTAERTIKDALVVPRTAVKSDDKGSYVTVITAEGEQRREVLLGAGNDEQVQVVHGLEEGATIKP